MRNLYTLIFILSITLNAFSQKEKPLNNSIYDNQVYHFGFTLGISQNKFSLQYSDLFTSENDFDKVLSKYDPGFNVGIIIDLRIINNINIRITPSFNFSDQKLYYTKDNKEQIQPSNNTGISNFEIPIYLKYRSDRINNGRAYLLGGGNFTYNMSNSDELLQNENISFKKINYSIDVGFGVDIYFAYFKFSPEIKYSYGLRDLLIQQDNKYSNVLNGITTRGLLISLTFE